LSCKALREIVENDISSKPYIKRKDRVLMEDETTYMVISSVDKVRGHIFDQLIIVDDSRWMIFEKQEEILDWMKYRLFHSSCVPEEFQIQKYEYPVIN